jgi:two-component system nitrogen regulation sensor histidine kinase GlnL
MTLKTPSISLGGLELLTAAVLILNAEGVITYANTAAENLFKTSAKVLAGQKMNALFLHADELDAAFQQALAHQFADKRQDLTLERAGREALHVNVVVTALDSREMPVLVELRENVQQLKLDREAYLRSKPGKQGTDP